MQDLNDYITIHKMCKEHSWYTEDSIKIPFGFLSLDLLNILGKNFDLNNYNQTNVYNYLTSDKTPCAYRLSLKDAKLRLVSDRNEYVSPKICISPTIYKSSLALLYSCLVDDYTDLARIKILAQQAIYPYIDNPESLSFLPLAIGCPINTAYCSTPFYKLQVYEATNFIYAGSLQDRAVFKTSNLLHLVPVDLIELLLMPKTTIKHCLNCKSLFAARHKNQKFCQACQYLHTINSTSKYASTEYRRLHKAIDKKLRKNTAYDLIREQFIADSNYLKKVALNKLPYTNKVQLLPPKAPIKNIDDYTEWLRYCNDYLNSFLIVLEASATIQSINPHS